MIARRGPHWWHLAIKRGSRLLVLDFDEAIGGYASYGRNRVPSLQYGGEICRTLYRAGISGTRNSEQGFSTWPERTSPNTATIRFWFGPWPTMIGRCSSTPGSGERTCGRPMNDLDRRHARASHLRSTRALPMRKLSWSKQLHNPRD